MQNALSPLCCFTTWGAYVLGCFIYYARDRRWEFGKIKKHCFQDRWEIQKKKNQQENQQINGAESLIAHWKRLIKMYESGVCILSNAVWKQLKQFEYFIALFCAGAQWMIKFIFACAIGISYTKWNKSIFFRFRFFNRKVVQLFFSY